MGLACFACIVKHISIQLQRDHYSTRSARCIYTGPFVVRAPRTKGIQQVAASDCFAWYRCRPTAVGIRGSHSAGFDTCLAYSHSTSEYLLFPTSPNHFIHMKDF